MQQPVEDLGLALQHVSFMLQRQADQVLRERLGIGMAQYRLLLALKEDADMPRRLASKLGQTEASISRQVKLLREKGMVDVQINPKSRREHIMQATTKGIRLTEAASETLRLYYQPHFENYGDKQIKQFSEMLAHLHGHICATGKPYACVQSAPEIPSL